jgi:ParB family transcriptional regulator, chromosome partitioning protein
MNIQTVSLSQLVPSKGNPRKAFDASGIEGLAASIKTDGLLQNLVVTPASGKGKRYSIVGGERRYRALKLLEERGELAEDFGVTVEIRKGLSKDESLRISTVENLQRQNVAPLEEAAAPTKLVHKGTTLEDVAAQTGLSTTTIRRRLALNGLCKEAKAALREGKVSLSQAEALTLGGDQQQKVAVEEILSGRYLYTADEIREGFLDDRPTVSLAIFPLEQYNGSITTCRNPGHPCTADRPVDPDIGALCAGSGERAHVVEDAPASHQAYDERRAVGGSSVEAADQALRYSRSAARSPRIQDSPSALACSRR